jgi:hypothetical protein
MKTRDRPAPDWTAVLRRRPARIVAGRPEGGYTNMFEIICRDCGDQPGLDYREVSPQLQRTRGPYPIAAGVTAYETASGCTTHPPATPRLGGVTGAFVHTFVDYQAPTNPVPRYDLDISSMSLVKLLKNGRSAAYPDLPWEPKEAFRAVADYYAER